MRDLIKHNEVRLYQNSKYRPFVFNVRIKNNWFSERFVYKVYTDRIVFSRPTLDYRSAPIKGIQSGNCWQLSLNLPDQYETRLLLEDQDINEDQVILYRHEEES